MCTLALLRSADGFILWHSRDEHRTRLPGFPPRVERQQGTGWIAPTDADAGGTWVGVNTCAVATGIANLFVGARPVPPAVKVSRGLLVRGLLGLGSVAKVRRTLESMDLSPYQPFTLVSLEPGAGPLIVRWDRQQLTPVAPLSALLLVTSAGGHREIEEARRRSFEALEEHSSLIPADIEALYRAQPDPEGRSVTVNRPDVATVSLTRIEVVPDQVRMIYAPGPPSTTPAGAPVVLSRSG